MKLRELSVGAMALSWSLGAQATDQWQHRALCGPVVKGLATSQFAGALPNERVVDWLGRNGWELAAIESDHCVADNSTLQRPQFENLFWFKRRVDSKSILSAMPAASGAR